MNVCVCVCANQTGLCEEARTRVAREKEFAAKILTPDAVAAAEGDTGLAEDGNTIPDEELDRMLLDDEDDDDGENKGGGAANRAAAAVAVAGAGGKEGEEAAAAKKTKKKKVQMKIEKREMPPPRATVNVSLNFTKLETDHMPARANRENEIREWKRSQKALGATGLGEDAAGAGVDGAGDITEREPIFLKDKGDAFFKAGNFRSALAAYTQAVETEKQAGGIHRGGNTRVIRSFVRRRRSRCSTRLKRGA